MNELVVEILRRNGRPLEPIPTGVEPRLARLPDVSAVLFDIYGTLFISGSGDVGHAAADPPVQVISVAADAAGLMLDRSPESILEDFYAAIRQSHESSRDTGIEFPEVDILAIWSDVLGDLLRDEVTAVRFAVEFESRSNPVWPMPGLREVLSTIGGSHPMGIVSNAQFFTLDLFAAFLDQDRVAAGFHPDLEVFSFREKQAKPGVGIYEIAVEKLAKRTIRPENVLYVGNDMLNDISGAQAVGFRTCLFAGDRRSLRWREGNPGVEGVVPDLIVNHLSQITDCLA